MWKYTPPKMQMLHATTMMAIIAPLESCIEPLSGPEAPASVSTCPFPPDDPASPGVGPVHILASIRL